MSKSTEKVCARAVQKVFGTSYMTALRVTREVEVEARELSMKNRTLRVVETLKLAETKLQRRAEEK